MYDLIFSIYKRINTYLFTILNYLINLPHGFNVPGRITYYFGGIIYNQTGCKDNVAIGKNCQIGGRISVYGNAVFKLGDYSYINIRSKIVAINKVTIGDYCIIAQDVHIEDTNNHPLD